MPSTQISGGVDGGKHKRCIGDGSTANKTMSDNEIPNTITVATASTTTRAVTAEKSAGGAGATATVSNSGLRSSSSRPFLRCYRCCCGRGGCRCSWVGGVVVSYCLLGHAIVADADHFFPDSRIATALVVVTAWAPAIAVAVVFFASDMAAAPAGHHEGVGQSGHIRRTGNIYKEREGSNRKFAYHSPLNQNRTIMFSIRYTVVCYVLCDRHRNPQN